MGDHPSRMADDEHRSGLAPSQLPVAVYQPAPLHRYAVDPAGAHPATPPTSHRRSVSIRGAEAFLGLPEILTHRTRGLGGGSSVALTHRAEPQSSIEPTNKPIHPIAVSRNPQSALPEGELATPLKFAQPKARIRRWTARTGGSMSTADTSIRLVHVACRRCNLRAATKTGIAQMAITPHKAHQVLCGRVSLTESGAMIIGSTSHPATSSQIVAVNGLATMGPKLRRSRGVGSDGGEVPESPRFIRQ